MTTLTAKGEATRARIVEAAAAEIVARGATQTSLDQVKVAAGVSSSQLYHYFGDKRQLVLAVIHFQTDSVLELQPEELDTVEALRAWADRVLDFQHSNESRGGCPVGSIGDDLAETDPEVRAAVATAFARWQERLQAGFTLMRDRGELNAEPEKLAAALLSALQGGLLISKMRRDPSALRAALDTVIDHVEQLSSSPAKSSR